MITLCYTYYDNYPAFERMVNYYKKLKNPNVRFLIIDDGSPNRPLTKKDTPKGWDMYRITEDVGWNNEGAKNLAMHVAETEWVVLLDLDHILFADVFMGLHRITELPEDKAPFFRRPLRFLENGQPEPNTDPLRQFAANSYAITKTHFWKLGGYDESLQGFYGYDSSMVRQLRPNNAGSFHCGLDGFDYHGGSSSWTRDEKDASKHELKKNGIPSVQCNHRTIEVPMEAHCITIKDYEPSVAQAAWIVILPWWRPGMTGGSTSIHTGPPPRRPTRKNTIAVL